MKSFNLPDLNQLSLAEQVAQRFVCASGYLFDDQIDYAAVEADADILLEPRSD